MSVGTPDAFEEMLERSEAELERLRQEDARPSVIGAAAIRWMTVLLDLGHIRLAYLHASQYGPYWESPRQARALEGLAEIGGGHQARALCATWKLWSYLQEHAFPLYQILYLQP